MLQITAFGTYVMLLGFFAWPLTLLAAIGFAWLGYRVKTPGWRIVLWGIVAFLAFPLLMISSSLLSP